MTTTVEFYNTEHERQIARDMDRLRGRLLGLIDVANLDYEQAKPMKDLVKSLTKIVFLAISSFRLLLFTCIR